MEPDDHVCHCYHVSLRKLVRFARRKRPARASQLSECLGAGTGCGWCIPLLQRIHAWATDGRPDKSTWPADLAEADAGRNAEDRRRYIDSGRKNEF